MSIFIVVYIFNVSRHFKCLNKEVWGCVSFELTWTWRKFNMLLLFVIQKSKLCCQDITYRVQYTMCNDWLDDWTYTVTDPFTINRFVETITTWHNDSYVIMSSTFNILSSFMSIYWKSTKLQKVQKRIIKNNPNKSSGTDMITYNLGFYSHWSMHIHRVKGSWRDTEEEASLVLTHHASNFELPSAMFDELYVFVYLDKN